MKKNISQPRFPQPLFADIVAEIRRCEPNATMADIVAAMTDLAMSDDPDAEGYAAALVEGGRTLYLASLKDGSA